MIKIENFEVVGWEPAIRGMRNPMNSWGRSDTGWCPDSEDFGPAIEWDFDQGMKKSIGPNDHELMMKLAKGGPVHAKYRRMIVVYADVTAPLYWWKEFDTYKVGTVANSCSTMHKIHEKEFTLEDFSHGRLDGETLFSVSTVSDTRFTALGVLHTTVQALNYYRNKYLETKNKDDWYQMIQLLPSSYNQKRTVMLNYEVLAGIYPMRKNHKLDEWRGFCNWIKELPYSELILVNDKEETSFQQDLEFFVNDCTKAQLLDLYEYIEKKLDIRANENTCVFCGESVPEGRQCCPKCMDDILGRTNERKEL